jgi:hypothetical protein
MADAPRKRRWPWYLATLALLLLLGAWWVNRQLEPNRLTATVLERVGTTLGLELSIDGTPEYALRPEPRLVLPNLAVRRPGIAEPLLTAVRAEVSLPWDTILGGESLVITRVELDQPYVDLDALLEWQSSRPPSDSGPLTLSSGASVRGGTVDFGDWRIDRLDLDVDRFESSQPLVAQMAGRAATEGFEVEVSSTVSIESLTQSTALTITAEGDARFGETDSRFSLESECNYHKLEPQESISCHDLIFRGASPLPTFKTFVSLDRGLDGKGVEIRADGGMGVWPEDWPQLPAPMAGQPTRFDLRYSAPAGETARVRAKLRWKETEADVSFVLSDVLAWLDSDPASPLPPLLGTMSTPSMEIGGATLEGVTIQFDDDGPAETEPTP